MQKENYVINLSKSNNYKSSFKKKLGCSYFLLYYRNAFYIQNQIWTVMTGYNTGNKE